MFCEKCGAKLADGERFCGSCGSPVTPPIQQPAAEQTQPAAERTQPAYADPAHYDQQPYANAAQYDQQPYADAAQYNQQPYADPAQYGQQPADQYSFRKAEKKPRKKINFKRIGIIAGAVVLCVGIFIAIALATGMFKSDQDRMQDVTKDAVHKLFSKATDLLDSDALDDLGSFTLQVEPGAALKSIGASQGINLDWIRDLKVDVATENVDGKMNVGARIVVNDVEIGQLNAVVDPQRGKVLLGIDGLSDSMAQIDTRSMGISSYSMPSGMSTDALKELMKDIDPEDVTDLLEDYIEAALDALDDVEKSKGSITANGVTGDCTLYTIKISQKTVMDMAKKLIEKALDDGSLKDLLEKIYPSISSSIPYIGGSDFNSFYSMMKMGLQQALKSMESAASEATTDTICTIVEYVDDGDIVGLRVEVPAADADIFFGFAQDGDNFGVELTAMGYTFIKGSGTKDGDALTGDIQVVKDDQPLVNIKLIDFDAEENEGAVELSLPSFSYSAMGLDPQMASVLSSLSLRMEKHDDVVTFDLGAMGQSAFKSTVTKGEKKSVSINTSLPTTDMESWVESLDVDALKDRLVRAGMPEETMDKLMELMGLDIVDPDDPFAGENNIKLTVWASDKELTERMCDAFIAQYPKKKIDITVELTPEADAASMMMSDPDTGADVFGFPCDQISRLYDADVLSTLPFDRWFDVEYRDSEDSIRAAEIDGDLYAYPMTGENGYYLVYDKRYVSDADAQTLEGVLKACRKAGKKFIMDSTNGFYACVFPFTGGLEITGMEDGVQQFNDYDEDEVLDTLEAFNKLFTEYKDVFQADSCDKISSGMEKNTSTVSAGIDGSWNIAKIRSVLGDNYGAVKLPTISVKGSDRQLVSINGYKFLGVNKYSQFPNAAHLLADYLTDEECQQLRAEELGWSPSNLTVMSSDTVQSNPGCVACLDQAQYSVPQVGVANTFWTPMGNLGSYITKGAAHTRAEIKTEFEKMIKNIKDE